MIKINRIKKKKTSKNFFTTTLTKIHILTTSLFATMFGCIMSVQYGFLNAILSKKMVQLMSKESKIFKKDDSNINAAYVKKLKQELV